MKGGSGSALAEEIRSAVAEALESERERIRDVIREELARVPPGEDRLLSAEQAAREVFGGALAPVALLRRAERGSLPKDVVVRQGRRIYFRARGLMGYAATERRGVR